MATWTHESLEQIAATDDLHIAPYHADGKTTGTPIWIWSVVVDGRLFVRAYNGASGRWYRSAISQRSGKIAAARARREVRNSRTCDLLSVHSTVSPRTVNKGASRSTPIERGSHARGNHGVVDGEQRTHEGEIMRAVLRHAPGDVRVDEIGAAYAQARKRGYEIVHPLTSEERDAIRLFVRAPGGNILTVVHHRE